MSEHYYSEELLLNAKNLYDNGKSIAFIAKEFNVDRHQISRRLQERGYISTGRVGCFKYDNTGKDALMIAEEYKQGVSMEKLAKKYNISTNVIGNILFYNKVEKRKPSSYRKHEFNQNLFNIIDTEQKAYWLGFLMADVDICELQYRIDLTLKEGDKNHVMKFVKFMEGKSTEVKLREVTLNGKVFKASRASFQSKITYNDLVKLGCGPCKSLTLVFPNIPDELVHHFMRGYFDGDGSVGAYKIKSKPNARNQLGFTVIGTLEFITKYDSYLRKLGINETKFGRDGEAYNVSHGGNKQCKIIYDFLYKDATIFLERKKLVFIAAFSQNYRRLKGIRTELSGEASCKTC